MEKATSARTKMGDLVRRGQLSQTKDHVSVEIKLENESLLSSIKEKLETESILRCISRVPENLCAENQDAYHPKLVSIGPLHYGECTLKAMEHHKWRYLQAILNRKRDYEATLDSCVNALKELEYRTRNSYTEMINLKSEELITMMLVDGCFIIELLFKMSIKTLRHRDDPLLNTIEKLNFLRHDMILLENQIPFFVLQSLFNIVSIPPQGTETLTMLALRFFRNYIPGNPEALQEKVSLECHHLLDLVRCCFLPKYPKVQPNRSHKYLLHCATKLQESGIRIKRERNGSLLDIKFADGILRIPPLKILKHAEFLMRNVIALELRCSDCTKFFPSYAFLMNSLIHSPEDVEVLHRRGILTNSLDDKEEVSEFFKKLCKEVSLEENYYDELCHQVHGFRKSKMRVWRLESNCSSLKTPLTTVWLVLAVLFLILILIGTIFSVLSFTSHRFK